LAASAGEASVSASLPQPESSVSAAAAAAAAAAAMRRAAWRRCLADDAGEGACASCLWFGCGIGGCGALAQEM
jgi:hypothetical protein